MKHSWVHSRHLRLNNKNASFLIRARKLGKSVAKRLLLGIHSRDGEFLRLGFSSPFGPEIVTFSDPDGSIENKIKHLLKDKDVLLVWSSDGIKIKRNK